MYYSPNKNAAMKSRRMGWVGYVASMEEVRNKFRNFSRKLRREETTLETWE
jgi:hypothetical protein